MTPEKQILDAIVKGSLDSMSSILKPILEDQAKMLLLEEALSGAEAIRRFGITKHDLPYLASFKPSNSRNKKYQVKDIIAYINDHKRNAERIKC